MDTPSSQDLSKIFNTALVATQGESVRDFSAEIYRLIESPAFAAILRATEQLAQSQGVSERQAAELIIQTFRKMDRLWGSYVFQEGLERLKGSNL